MISFMRGNLSKM